MYWRFQDYQLLIFAFFCFITSLSSLQIDFFPLLSNYNIDGSGRQDQCWGFEEHCLFNNSYSKDHVKCSERNSSRWPLANTNLKKLDLFWKTGDFGSLKARYSSITTICNSTTKEGSSLECSDHLRFCLAKNIFFDFKGFNAKRSLRYRTDVIHDGEVGGRCDSLDKQLLQARADERGYLRSWADELVHFGSFSHFNINNPSCCDVVFEKPTIIIKLDAAVNMYHHFCDFINLFASQFLNGTSFGQDVEILWWDTHQYGFVDTAFGVTWKAFSLHRPHELVDYDGKKICFRQAMFPLLARQLFGLYYNMPLVDGCQGSGLFHVFAHHILHRLGVEQDHLVDENKIRITLLARDTPFRRILNINELFHSLFQLPNVQAKIVNYERKGGLTFLEQLRQTHNSDIFIGMHGSGLTHLLFLPDWAAVFEIYNCEDTNCYSDLARLRGVHYRTWLKEDKLFPENIGLHPTMKTPHKKFTNYSFDVAEFLRIVRQMIENVRRHPAFVERKLWRQHSTNAGHATPQHTMPKKNQEL